MNTLKRIHAGCDHNSANPVREGRIEDVLGPISIGVN